jgi:2-methylcitrate dehydratase PrpD
VLKAHAAMGGLHAGIDGLLDLVATHRFRAEDVERIDVDLSHAVYHHGWWDLARPITPIAAQMNIAYALAVTLLDGEAMVRQFAPERIDRDDVWALIPRIRAHHDAGFDQAGALGRGRTRLRIRLRDGTELLAEQPAPKSALHPMSREQVVAKYRRLTDGLLTAQRQRAIEDCLLSLDDLEDSTTLTELLAGPVGSAMS